MTDEKVSKADVVGTLEAFTNWGKAGIEFVARNYGDEAVEKYLRDCGPALVEPILRAAGGDGRKIIDLLEPGHRLMGSKTEIVEDDEKKQLVIICNSGGRMKRQDLITCRRKDGTPYYCYHCTVWWETMLREAGYDFKFHYSEEGACICEFRKK